MMLTPQTDVAVAQALMALKAERDKLRDLVRRAIPFVEGIVNAGAIVNADDPDVVPFLTKEQKAAARKAYEEAVPMLAEARAAIGEAMK